MANDRADDLDELLDSALDDFKNLNLASAQRSGGDEKKEDEEKKKESGSYLSGVQGLGMGLPELRSKKKGKQKVAKENHVAEALSKLREQTRETVKGLESLTAQPASEETMADDWIKQFEEFSGAKDMESIMDTMMQQLLSKDILHEPMKEIGERYPKWLQEHGANLSREEYERYFHQFELIKELNEVYENEPGNFTKIVDLMQKMQECGQPPNDIVHELAPDLDFASLSQSPEMLESQPNCCIM